MKRDKICFLQIMPGSRVTLRNGKPKRSVSPKVKPRVTLTSRNCHSSGSPEGPRIIMSTPFKGVQHIVLLRLASALASGLTLRHPLLDFFWVHQNMIPAIWRSFSTGDLDHQGQGQSLEVII